MPQGNDYFGDTKDALRMMIPLVINRRNIEANAEEQDKRISALKEQYNIQLQREINKQKAEEEQAKRKVQVESTLKRLERAEETQSTEQFQALASQLSGQGIQLPTHFSSPEGVDRFQMLPPKPMTPFQEEDIGLRRQALQDSAELRRLALEDRQNARAESSGFRQQMLDLQRDRLDETKNKNLRDEQGTKPEKGWRWNENRELEPIPGGKPDLKIRGQYSADVAGVEKIEDTLNRTESTIDQLLKNDNGLKWLTGYTGYAPDWVSQEKKDASVKLDELKNKIFVQAVDSMKAVSANGSTGLGQLTEREGDKIQGSFANLERAQNYDQMKKSLMEIKSVLGLGYTSNCGVCVYGLSEKPSVGSTETPPLPLITQLLGSMPIVPTTVPKLYSENNSTLLLMSNLTMVSAWPCLRMRKDIGLVNVGVMFGIEAVWEICTNKSLPF
jgi:hypothetical protein